MSKVKSRFAMGGVVVLCVVAGYTLRHAQANVPTGPGAFTYSGFLTDANGAVGAAQGTAVDIDVRLFDAESGGTELCAYTSPDVSVALGHFDVPLDGCDAEAFSGAETWVEVTVDGNTLGPGRSRVGAVPYAVEASRHVVTNGNAATSVGGQFCGSTTTTHTGDLGGIVAGHALCKDATETPGCGGKATAHICTAEEISRSYALSAVLPTVDGWIEGPFSAADAPSHGRVTNCNGWTLEAHAGHVWLSGSGFQNAGARDCDLQIPVHCCE